MSDAPTIAAWEKWHLPVDESEFTPGAAKGWMAWNGQSPEVDVCMFAQWLCVMMRPKLVIETGVGQGYMTRAIVPTLGEGQKLIAYESDDAWRAALWTLPFWTDHRFIARISERPTPVIERLCAADLCILDSDFEWRWSEIQGWNEWAKPGAVALIHDTADRPDTIHQSLRDLILDLGMTGTFLNNPRGSFLAVQPEVK